MNKPWTGIALLAGFTLLSVPTARAQQVPDSLPDGVTAEMVSQGAALYNAQGLCFACHGPDATGMPNLGADLTDDEWTHGDGSYAAILATIEKGAQAPSGAVMPPNGGSSLNDAQRKAVAAYVWSLSRGADDSRRR